MKDCTDCKFDNILSTGSPPLVCDQGHQRSFDCSVYGASPRRVPINNCHACQEKKQCDCLSYDDIFPVARSVFFLTCKKCGRQVE